MQDGKWFFFCRPPTHFCGTQGWKYTVTTGNTRLSKITGKRELWVWGLGKSDFSGSFKLWSPWHTWLCLRNAKKDHNSTCSCLHPRLSIPHTPEGGKPGTAVAARDEAQKVSSILEWRRCLCRKGCLLDSSASRDTEPLCQTAFSGSSSRTSEPTQWINARLQDLLTPN